MTYPYVIVIKQGFYSAVPSLLSVCSAVPSVLSVCSRLSRNSHTLSVIYKSQRAACVGNEPGRARLYAWSKWWLVLPLRVFELFVTIQKLGRKKMSLDHKFCNNDF